MNNSSDEPSAAAMQKGKRGLRRVYNAFFYSVDGLRCVFRHEPAFRQELVLAAVLLPTAALLPLTLSQKALLCASVLLVLVVELINSALEATIDRISAERHELAKRAKDAGSAAVLLAIVNCVLSWTLVLADALG